MIPFALANVMTHAGVNPLCFCCCDKDELGGHQFDDQPTKPRTRLNPLVKVIPGTVDNAVDSDASVESGVTLLEQETHHRHQIEHEVNDESDREGRQIPTRPLVETHALPNDEYLDLLKVIQLIEDDEHNNKIRIKLTTNLHERDS